MEISRVPGAREARGLSILVTELSIIEHSRLRLVPAIMLSLWRRNWAILAGILAGFIVLARFFDDLWSVSTLSTF